MRKFQFEAEIYESLYCLPMAARRKLDRIGLKVSLEQWQGLSRAEHLAVCYMPANTSDECQLQPGGSERQQQLSAGPLHGGQ